MKFEKNHTKLTLAQAHLEKASVVAQDEFLFNVSAQLAKESIQKSLEAFSGQFAVNKEAQNDLLDLYKEFQPFINGEIDKKVLAKIVEGDFMESDEKEFNSADIRYYLDTARMVYNVVKEKLTVES